MLEFIIKYWVELGLGLLTTAMAAIFAYFKKYYKKGIDTAKQEEKEAMISEIKLMLQNQNLDLKNQLA